MVEKYAVTEGAFSGLFHDVFGGSALAFADAVANGTVLRVRRFLLMLIPVMFM